MGNNDKSSTWITVIVVIIILACIGSCSNTGEDHNDGKCDICGKTATYSDSSEEYCRKHLEKAIEYYLGD